LGVKKVNLMLSMSLKMG